MEDKKVFHISADFELKDKPGWLDAFRAKYDLPYDYHITFKTDTFFESKDLERLKAELKAFADSHKPIKMVFDEIFIAQTPKGWCIMIKAKSNKELSAFQKSISKKFSKYGDIVSKEKESYEKDFQPHITIGRHLTDDQLKKAKSEMGKNLVCDAIIQNLVLTTVNEPTFEQWCKPENRTFYKLKQ